MAADSEKPVRFSTLVEQSGKPDVHVLLVAPESDEVLQKAIKGRRIVSLKQEPTSTRKDFGIVGFLNEKHVSYLIFPKALKAAEGQRVVGLKYELVEQPKLSPEPTSKPKPARKPTKERKRVEPTPEKKRPEPKPPPPPPPEPKPKEFKVKLRITTVSEKEIVISALKKTEAKDRALEEARRDLPPEAQVKVVEVTAAN